MPTVVIAKSQQEVTKPTLGTLEHLVASSSGNRKEGLLHWAPEDTFYVRLLLSRPGDVVHPPNSQKQTQRVRQNEEKEEYVSNERIRQNLRTRTKQNRGKQST